MTEAVRRTLDEFVENHVRRTGNAGVVISGQDSLLLLDPYMTDANESSIKAAIGSDNSSERVAMFSHGHYDHGFRAKELGFLLKQGFSIIAPKEIREAHQSLKDSSELMKIISRFEEENRINWVENGELVKGQGYNVNIAPSKHAKVRKWDYIKKALLKPSQLAKTIKLAREHKKHPEGSTLLYDIDFNGTRISFLGSCNYDPEAIKQLNRPDILLLPLSEDAAKKAEPEYTTERAIFKLIRPGVTIPIHDDPIDALMTEKDGLDFLVAADSTVKVLTPIYLTNVMRNEVSNRNWGYLLDYIEKMDDHASGLKGRSAVDAVLKGLINNPKFLIQDPNNPHLAYQVKEEHLRDKRYWVSNEFSQLLLKRAAEVIGGHRPVYRAGVWAGYMMMLEKLPKRFQMLRLLSPNLLIKLASKINRKMNKTKNPSPTSYIRGNTIIPLNYTRRFRNPKEVSQDVCDWNAGIYTGMGKYVGARDIVVKERECITRGDNDCIFNIDWTHVPMGYRALIFLESIFFPDNRQADDLDHLLLTFKTLEQERIIEERTKELREALALAETRYKQLIETQGQLITETRRTAEKGQQLNFAGRVGHHAGSIIGGILDTLTSMTQYHPDERQKSLKLTEEGEIIGEVRYLERCLSKFTEYLISAKQGNISIDELISSSVDLLNNAAKLINDLDDKISRVHSGAERALQIANGLTKYTKIDQYKRGSDSLSLHTLFRGYIDPYRERIESGGIRIINHIDPAEMIRGDEETLAYIFEEIFNNSIKALTNDQDSGKEKTITLKAYEERDNGQEYLVVNIVDTGIGMRPEVVERIFEPLYQVNPEHKGFGLGLSFAKRVTEEVYNGSIIVVSKEGEGSSFIIKIPI